MNKSSINKILFLILIPFFPVLLHAQTDTSRMVPLRDDTLTRKVPSDSLPIVAEQIQNTGKIDSVLKTHSPRKAAIRSAIIPGWGQIYNRKYWKLPIVYGALGVSGAVFLFNIGEYRDLRFAVQALSSGDPAEIAKINPLYRGIEINALRSYRDEFRRNIDYSVLAFLVLWGLNVVDASVDAHLKSFDVSPDLSFNIKFGKSPLAGTTGLSLVLSIK